MTSQALFDGIRYTSSVRERRNASKTAVLVTNL